MNYTLITLSAILLLAVFAIGQSEQKSECEQKRESAQRQLRDGSTAAILVPECNKDGTFATLQCHNNSPFCQCWDSEGLPLTQPKKNLKKCSCMVDRAKALKSVRPSETDPVLTACETDGSYTAKQCNRDACWCVNPDSGKKVSDENKNKSGVRC